jgi:Na+-transporting NADH:ubiquinone oxidoreductase subunit NqrB
MALNAARVMIAGFAADARHVQLAALSTLVLLSNFWSDFGSGVPSFAAAAAGTLGAQALFARLRGQSVEWRSALITAFSLALLLRAPTPLWHLAAGFAAMSAKFLIRVNGKHLFNPANFAVVAAILLFDAPWISPGQWGQVAWVVGLIVVFAALVLGRARRLDIALAFLLSYAGLLLARALYLGDPVEIPLHQLQSGALLIFTGFMITDPRSTADHRAGRIGFAIAVAAVAVLLQIKFQLVGAPLFALALLSPVTPLIDRFLPARRFEWRPKMESLA